MLDAINTILSILGVSMGGYEMVSTILQGDSTDKMLAEMEQTNRHLERLNEHILYAPDLHTVRDTNRTVQQVETDHQKVYQALDPVQQALGGDILSSAVIVTPEQMRQAMRANPFDVLLEVRPVSFAQPHSNPSMVPIIFDLDGTRYIGWQTRGVLPMLFHVEYMTGISKPTPALPKTKIEFDWVHIPAGEFKMGRAKGQGWDNEEPQHTVYLDEYYIARVPTTNRQYEQFVKATGHPTPRHWENGKIPNGKADHPVVQISWDDAVAFSKWVSVQLPTEAQWEKAARGTDGRVYPWGNAKPNEKICNFGKNVGDTTPVGKYPEGASPYGCLDMAGNVLEWVADWYDENYYQSAPKQNPTGPKSGSSRVLRGGSWYNYQVSARVEYRYGNDQDLSHYNVGCRSVFPIRS